MPKFAPITLQNNNLKEFAASAKLAHDNGYKGIDLFMDEKTDDEINQIKGILCENDLKIAMLICIDLADKGVNLTCDTESERKKSVEIYLSKMKYAKALGALSMPFGLLRGNILANDTKEAFYERLRKSSEVLLKGAEENNTTLCIEPINRYEINNLCSLKETVQFIKDYKLDGMKIVPDLFHMNIEDVNMEQELINAGDLVFHMHVSDSNRKAPGMGHVNYHTVLKALKEINYDGYLTLETTNGDEKDTIVSQGARYLNEVLASL